MTTLKIVSWNVNGLQSVLKRRKDGSLSTIAQLRKNGETDALTHFVASEQPDVLCLQEIRCSTSFDHSKHLSTYKYIYTSYSTVRKGYSGVLTATNQKPLSVHYGLEQLGETLEDAGLTSEGRLIVLEYENLFILCVYVPNSGIKGLGRLQWRTEVWDVYFQ